MVRILHDGKQVALGSIIDADGFIATKGSELVAPMTCELADGTQYNAQLVGIDYGSDLALLKISAQGLPTMRWSNDEPPTVGGWVVTPGTGELPQAIGIVSVAPHRVRGGVLGVRLTEDEHGPRITDVVPQSGAAKAGLTSGDIVTQINGKPVKDSEAMVATTSALLPGEEIQLSILRHGERRDVAAVLGSVSDTLLGQRARFQDHLGTSLSTRRYLFPSALEHDSILAPTNAAARSSISMAKPSASTSPASTGSPVMRSPPLSPAPFSSRSRTGRPSRYPARQTTARSRTRQAVAKHRGCRLTLGRGWANMLLVQPRRRPWFPCRQNAAQTLCGADGIPGSPQPVFLAEMNVPREWMVMRVRSHTFWMTAQ